MDSVSRRESLYGRPSSVLIFWVVCSYLLLSPMIYLLTPSTSACLQSVLHALSAPASKRSSGSLASAADAAKEQDGLLQGGKLVRDCEGGE